MDDLTSNPADDLVAGAPQTFHPAVLVEPVAVPVEPVVAEAPAPVAATEAPVETGDMPEAPAPAFIFPAPDPLNNATQESPYSKKITIDKWDDLATTISLPPDTGARTRNFGELNPNTEIADTADGDHWADVIDTGLRHGSLHDNMLPAAKREGANWRQRIQAGASTLSIAQPRFGSDDEGPLLTGERGMLRVNALMGRGAIIQVPLWHSGFWITLKVPGEVDLLNAYQQIMENQVTLGRVTNGLAFANHSVFDAGAIVDLAMKSLYETSVKDVTTEAQLRSMIKVPDLHMLAWGLACVIFPKGFQFERSLLDPAGKAVNVVRENLNVGACLWVDRSSLDDWQVAHMAKRGAQSMTVDQVKLYGDHFTRGAPKSVMLNDVLGMTQRVPSIDDYLLAGQLWVDEMVASVQAAFTQETDAKKRNALVLDRARATSMRQYIHWIESFDAVTVDKKAVEANTIKMFCDNLSSDDVTRAAYYKTMKEFINDSTVAIVAVPQVHPDEAEQALPRFENIIPLDPVSVFFTLLYQKIQQIQMRP